MNEKFTVKEYAEEVAKLIPYETKVKEVVKNNGVIRTGIIFTDDAVSPVLYVDEFYEYGATVDETAMRLTSQYLKSEGKIRKEMVETILDFEKTKDKIFPKLINTTYTREYVIDKPYNHWLDLSETYYIPLKGFNKEETVDCSIAVNNHILNIWGIDLKELHKVARENAHPVLESFSEVAPLAESMENIVGMPEMYVLSNPDRYFGAGVIVSDQAFDLLAKLGSDCILIPSSVHEWIVVPEENAFKMNPDILDGMIREVNEKELEKEDVLSDHAYFYDYQSNGIAVTIRLPHNIQPL